MCLLHDNAKPYKTRQVKEKIEDMGLSEFEHPGENNMIQMIDMNKQTDRVVSDLGVITTECV